MTTRDTAKPVVLTIGGFDPSGGAGIIADIRTIESLGCTAVAAITSVTFQTARKFFGAIHQPAESVHAQIEAILDAVRIAAVKIGMLPMSEIITEVASLIRENNLPAPVIDPVMKSTTGGRLMADDAFEGFVTELLPLARVVTPNIPEAEKLAGLNIRGEEEMQQATARIRELGVRAVLIKGGHLKEQRSDGRNHKSVVSMQKSGSGEREAVDLLDDDGLVTVFRGEWIAAPNVRGTGCMLSSAIATALAKGSDLEEAIAQAKAFVTDRIRSSFRDVSTDN